MLVMGSENWNDQNNAAEINAYAALSLRWALDAASLLKMTVPPEAANWSHIADHVCKF